MSKKILTDELIATRLRKANVLEPGGLEHNYMFKCVQDYYEFKITNEWGNPDMMFYTETTSDGYEVWIATDNDRNPSICDDVYYYDTDWLEKMPDAMYDGASIYYDQLDDEEYAFKRLLKKCMTNITTIKNKKLKTN